VAGGILPATDPPQVSKVVELYDPATETWQILAGLHHARYAFNLIALPHGQVMAVNGTRDWEGYWNTDSYATEIELYDLSQDQWQVIGEHPQPGAYATAVRLGTDRVWITGGQIVEWVLTDTWIINLPVD
jgi:N-acetylneuraminic acid mutarotase